MKLRTPQVNCFDLVGQTDAKTEGILRARFEQAAECTPCFLVLRHLDALAQTTVSGESGKGMFAEENLPDKVD